MPTTSAPAGTKQVPIKRLVALVGSASVARGARLSGGERAA